MGTLIGPLSRLVLGDAAVDASEAAPIKVDLSSSCVAALEYDPTSGTLTVEFRSGGEASYEGISREEFEAFASSSSPGAFFNARMRGR